MKRSFAILMLAAAAAFGCEGMGGDAAEDTAADAGNDRQLLKAAQAAANEVLQNATDCSALKAALPAAERAIADAEDNIQTKVGQTTLAALKRQIDTASQACP